MDIIVRQFNVIGLRAEFPECLTNGKKTVQAPRELCECRLRQLAGHTPDEIAAQMSVSRTTAFRALTGAPEIARRLRKGEQMRKVQRKCRTARCPALKRQVSCGIMLQ